MTTWTTDDEVDRSTQLTTSTVDGWTVKLSFLATKRLSNSNATPLPRPVRRGVSTMANPGGGQCLRGRSILAWYQGSVMANTSRFWATIVSEMAVDLFETDRALSNPNDKLLQ